VNKKTWFGQGVMRPCDKSFRLKAANGGKCNVAKGDKLRQIRCHILPQFDTAADAARFVGRMVKGMVSSENCPQIRARRVRDIRIEQMFRNVPINICQRIRWLPCARTECSLWVAG
jgi:hypothetical protein